jgi:acetyl esterase/lipase
VCFAGDSSGGNIALALTIYCLSGNSSFESCAPQAPGSPLLISPAVDLLHQHPDIKEVEKHDPMESLRFVRKTAASWAEYWGKPDSQLSPAKGAVNMIAEHKSESFWEKADMTLRIWLVIAQVKERCRNKARMVWVGTPTLSKR